MIIAEHTTGIFTTDAQLIVRTWNTWLQHVTGIAASEAQGRALTELIPDLETRGLLRRFQQVLASGSVSVLAPAFHRYLMRCSPQIPSRHFVDMQQRVTIGPLRDGDQVVGVIVTIEDVTARRERERDLADDLASADESTRLRAAQELAREEDAAPEALFGAMGDASWRVRQVVVGGLAQRGGSETLAALVQALHNDHQNPSVLNSALQVLARTPEDAVTPLIALLRSPDADLRGYVALALGERGDPLATPALMEALDDDDVNVRYHAIEALGKLRAREATQALTQIAESRDFFLAFPALDALVRIGDATVAARIMHLLDDELLSAPAAAVLGALGDTTAIAPLAAVLDRPDAPVLEVIQALASLYDRYEAIGSEGDVVARLASDAMTASGVRKILDALPTAPDNALRALTMVLGWLGGEPVHQALARLLAQPSVRAEAITALMRHSSGVVDLLIGQLASEDLETREAAIMALGRIGSSQAVPALLSLLTDDAELTPIIAGTLAKIGDHRAFEPLLGLLGHPQAAVRQAVIGALDSLGHPETATRIVTYLDDPDPRVRESAVRIAGYFGFPSCVEPLLARSHDVDEHVRRAAIEHLPYLEDQRVLPTLAIALGQDTPAVRAAATRALGQLEDQRAVVLLLKALDDADAWVRYYTARSLGQQVAPEAIGRLSQLAQSDTAMHVRIASLDALGEIGGEEAVIALVPFVRLDDDELALPALKALGKTGLSAARTALVEALQGSNPTRRAAVEEVLAQIEETV